MPCFAVQADFAAEFLRSPVEFVIEIRPDVLAAFCEAREGEGPEIDAGLEVLAELLLLYQFMKVPVGAGDELEIALHGFVGTERRECFVFNGTEEHGLFVRAKFPDFIEEQQTAIGFAQHAGAVGHGPGEGPLHVAEESAHGRVAAEGGAVDFHELSLQAAALPPQFADAAGELAFAGSGGACQQHGFLRPQGYLLDHADERIELGILGGDAAFQQIPGFGLFPGEARGEPVVAGEVEIDDVELAEGLVVLWRAMVRSCLEQSCGQTAGFSQEEQADLGDVGAGGDVDEVVLLVRIERIGIGKGQEPVVNAFKIPWIRAERDHVRADLGMRRAGPHVVDHEIS